MSVNHNQLIPGGLITREELCSKFKFSENVLIAMVQSGIVKGRQIGRSYVYLTSEIIEWVATQAPLKQEKKRKPLTDARKAALMEQIKRARETKAEKSANSARVQPQTRKESA